MEMKRYRNIVLILLVVFLITLLFYIILLQPSSESWAATVSIDHLSQFKNQEGEISADSNFELKKTMILEELKEDILVDDYQELIVGRNIFNLVKEEFEDREIEEDNDELIEEGQEKEKEEESNRLEKNLETNKLKDLELSNPFYLLASSINRIDKMAIIYNKNNYMTYIIKPGDNIDGYLVTKIDYTKVVMEKDGQEILVFFQK